MSRIISDFKVGGGWRKFKNNGGIKYTTKSYAKWVDMISRCRAGSARQRRAPTYIGCTVSESFEDFQFFADWHTRQTGYGEEGYNLDKDALSYKNKLYSETTCVLIPKQLNMFFLRSTASRGLYAQGVSFEACRKTNKWRVSLSYGGVGHTVGRFQSETEAFSAYKAAKEAEAYRWYERLKAGEFIVDERVIERMRTWTLEE